MEQAEKKFIIEIRNGYTIDEKGQFVGGAWETAKDEFGADMLFDYFFQAQRELLAKCPAIQVFGGNAGRVKEVEMVRKLK